MSEAVNAIAHRNWWDLAKKAGNTYMNFSFGCGQDTKFVESLFGKGEAKVKMGAKEAWTHAKLGESWWQSFKNAFKPSVMGEEWKGYIKGDLANGIKPAGNIRSAGRFFMKRMPFIGNAVALAFMELPNLYRAFTDKENGGGVGTGLVETPKAAIKMAAFAAGSALGATFVPVLGGLVGGIVGGMVGNWLASKALGKSFTEKKEEAEAQKAQLAQAQSKQQMPGIQAQAKGQQLPQSVLNPYGQSQFSSRNSIFETDWKDKDLMAMGAGLA